MCELGDGKDGKDGKDGRGFGGMRDAKPLIARAPRLAVLAVLTVLAVFPATPPLHAQDTAKTNLEESRRRLDQIRREREELRQQQDRLKGQVHDISDELGNLERQRNATSRLVGEIERQINGLSSQLDRTSAELILAQDNLAERRAVLERRLIEIYKRGNLYTFQALFAAESFGDLVSRYKYLYLTSRQDRSLFQDVERLRNRVVAQRNDLLNVRNELGKRREEREAELTRYNELASERSRRLESLQRAQQQTERRLAQLARDERTLNNALAVIEKTRRDEAARNALRGVAPTRGSITTADRGNLDWPVDGTILYDFGPDKLPNGGTITWHGIGIGTRPGTPVKAVESGTVRLVGRMGTYGLMVVLEHGNGYYSLYGQLQAPVVKVGDKVERGAILAQVGGQNSDYGPHLYFEIRGDDQRAMDPVGWLRRKR